MTTDNSITIASVQGREALDSRGNPTVEAEVVLSNGVRAHALVPSGASTGSYEALELRDRDASRFNGNGVRQAVANVSDTVGPVLVGVSPFDQSAIDRRLIELDGTVDKSNLGANALLAVSMATAQAAALAWEPASGELWRFLSNDGPVSLPVPLFNILNGGRHATDSTDVQEFMVAPGRGWNLFRGPAGRSRRFTMPCEACCGRVVTTSMWAMKGGFAPTLASNRDALEVVLRAVETAGLRARPGTGLPGAWTWQLRSFSTVSNGQLCSGARRDDSHLGRSW